MAEEMEKEEPTEQAEELTEGAEAEQQAEELLEEAEEELESAEEEMEEAQNELEKADEDVEELPKEYDDEDEEPEEEIILVSKEKPVKTGADMRCASCNLHISAVKNFVTFPCPSCSKELIIRCDVCKAGDVKYVCPQCNFEGP